MPRGQKSELSCLRLFKLTIFLTVIVIVSLVYSCKTDNSTLTIGQYNSVWCESIYLRGINPVTGERLTDLLTREFALTMKRNKIKYAYLFAGPYENDGHIPGYSFSQNARKTVKLIKQFYPELVILPWIGGIQNRTVHLEDSAWVNNAIADTRKLVDHLEVKGAHVDLEYIEMDDDFFKNKKNNTLSPSADYGINVNSFFEKLRILMPKAFISTVVVGNLPNTRPWKRKTSMDELRGLVKHVDQLSFLYYDTSINDQNVFDKNCKILLEDISLLEREVRDIEYQVGIGTFINEPALFKYRNLDIESIPNSLKTIKTVLRSNKDLGKSLSGIAIYCDWQTDSLEWNQFITNWRDEPKS